MGQRTITATAYEDDDTGPRNPTTRLVFLTEASDPRAPSASHPLDGLDEVRFLRGARDVERRGRTLTLSFPDRRMSATHGSLKRYGARWFLDVPDSKNGAIVDGAPASRAIVTDGSLFELGYSFFLFRHERLADPLSSHLARDIDARQLPAAPAKLSTFSAPLANEYANLARLATSQVPIALHGETGTGKEVVASAIHAMSRRDGAFVAVNCGAIAETLIESELFGHRRGAFSGAVSDRPGLIRSADGGTLFLDEIAELPHPAQATLLRVLQEGEVLPVGNDQAVPVDLRVVAATLCDLDAAVARGAFRADLHARIAGYQATLPPLRERREDFGLLIAAMLPPTSNVRFTPTALRALLRHDWPRNIRGLEQCLTAAIALAQGDTIDRVHLGATGRHRPTDPVATLSSADQLLREQLIGLFGEHGGNVAAVAAALGKQRQQVYKWIKRLAIDLTVFRR